MFLMIFLEEPSAKSIKTSFEELKNIKHKKKTNYEKVLLGVPAGILV